MNEPEPYADWPWDALDDHSQYGFEGDGVLEALEYGLVAAAVEFRKLTVPADDGEKSRGTAELSWVRETVAASLTLRTSRPFAQVDEEYWSLVGDAARSKEEHELNKQRLLQALRDAGVEVALLRSVGDWEYRDRSGEPNAVMRAGLLVEMARLGVAQLDSMVDRMLGARQLAMALPLSPDLSAYLQRVARLYVLGMDVEVAALARTTLEVALKERLSKSPPASPLAGATLATLIPMARARGVLSSMGADFATVIQFRGNLVIHGGVAALSQVGGPFGILSRLAYCLQEMSA